MPFIVTCTAIHDGTRIDNTNAHGLGDYCDAQYATRAEAEAVAQELRADAPDTFPADIGIEYHVEGDDLVFVVMEDVARGEAWTEQVHAEEGNPSDHAFFFDRDEAEALVAELQSAADDAADERDALAGRVLTGAEYDAARDAEIAALVAPFDLSRR